MIKQGGLLLPTDSFKFSCTGCGKCCHDLVWNIVLSPFDIYNMSRAAGLAFLSKDKRGYLTTTELHSYFGNAFNYGLTTVKVKGKEYAALFASLKPREGDSKSEETCYFAYPLVEKKKIQNNNNNNLQNDNKDNNKENKDEKMKKSVLKRSKTLLKDMELQSLEEFVREDGDRNFKRMKRKILCGLGSSMPSACLIYPLGDEGKKKNFD